MTNDTPTDTPGPEIHNRDNAHAVIEEVLGGFRGVCRGAMIFHSITSAMQPGRLVIALLMVMVLIAGGRLGDGMTEPDNSPAGLIAEYQQATAADPVQIVLPLPVSAEPIGTFAALASDVTDCFLRFVSGAVHLDCPGGLSAGHDLFITLPCALWVHSPTFTIIYGLFFLAVLALGGGAIARMSAVQTSRGGRLTVRESTNFALSHWVTLILTPILPLVVVVVLGLGLAGGGWIFFSIPFLDIVGGLGYALALLGGFFIAFLVIGYLAGFCLLIPAFCCEIMGAGDAMQRAYAYTLQRPLHLAWYFLLALLGLVLGYVVVALFAVGTLNFTAALAGLWTDHVALADAGGYSIFNLNPISPEFAEGKLTFNGKWTLGIIDFWRGLVAYMVVAWVFSYLCSASTTIYLLMRKAVDGQNMEEIWEQKAVD